MDAYDYEHMVKKIYAALIKGDTTTLAGCRAILGATLAALNRGTLEEFEEDKKKNGTTDELQAQLRDDVMQKLEQAMTPYYAILAPDFLIDDIINDVMVSSDYTYDGSWNDDDIHLAIGRALLKGAGKLV